MERLTKRLEDGQAVFHECHGTCGTCDVAICYCIWTMVDRLAAYEDTGLEPEDLKKAFDESAILKLAAQALSTTPDHLRDLLKAEQDGRLVVLPCKVGDTIYYTREGCPIVEPIKVRTFFVGDPTRRGEILHLHMIRTDNFDVSMDALGKTVFLTREEAEAALKGGEG